MTILKALNLFQSGGYMAERVRATGDQARSVWPKRQPPDDLLLTVRQNDSSLARGLLGVAMQRLRHVLDERINLKLGDLGEVLLLLDETGLIPGFDPASFVRIVRENRAGYVLVYQSLGLIEPKDRVPTLLSNIGVQIYFCGLKGEDLCIFNARRAGHELVRQWNSRQSGPAGAGLGLSEVGKDAPFLSPLAAERFPGGRFPALVAVRDGPPPLLVDFDEGTDDAGWYDGAGNKVTQPGHRLGKAFHDVQQNPPPSRFNSTYQKKSFSESLGDSGGYNALDNGRYQMILHSDDKGTRHGFDPHSTERDAMPTTSIFRAALIALSVVAGLQTGQSHTTDRYARSASWTSCQVLRSIHGQQCGKMATVL